RIRFYALRLPAQRAGSSSWRCKHSPFEASRRSNRGETLRGLRRDDARPRDARNAERIQVPSMGPVEEHRRALPSASHATILVARDAMTEKVSTIDVRQRIGDMLNRVSLRHDEFIIERKGKPLAALVPVERLEQMRRFAQAQAIDFLEQQKRGDLTDSQ